MNPVDSMYMLATAWNAFVGRQLRITINASTLPYQSEPCRSSYTINSSKQREQARGTPDGSKVSVQQPPSTTARRQLRIKTNWFINSVAVADLSVWGVIPNMFIYDVKLGSSGDIQGQKTAVQLRLSDERLQFGIGQVHRLCEAFEIFNLHNCRSSRFSYDIFFSQAISFCLVTTLVLL